MMCYDTHLTLPGRRVVEGKNSSNVIYEPFVVLLRTANIDQYSTPSNNLLAITALCSRH